MAARFTEIVEIIKDLESILIEISKISGDKVLSSEQIRQVLEYSSFNLKAFMVRLRLIATFEVKNTFKREVHSVLIVIDG